jgi:hypothetical protein
MSFLTLIQRVNWTPLVWASIALLSATVGASAQTFSLTNCREWVGSPGSSNQGTVPCTLTVQDINNITLQSTGGNSTLSRTSRTPRTFTLTGQWISYDYQCPAGTVLTETFSIKKTDSAFVATKIIGDDCVTSGHVSFYASGGEPEPPVFTCHAGTGYECAYTIHDAHGSINLVLASGQSHGYNITLIGAQYCINVALPHAPTPAWPQCLSYPDGSTSNGAWHKHAIVVAGHNNG